jgi:hypothetical protein
MKKKRNVQGTGESQIASALNCIYWPRIIFIFLNHYTMRLLLLFLICIAYTAHSQELVPNGGFEIELQPPCGYTLPGEAFDNLTANWYSPNYATPDYHSNSPGSCNPLPNTVQGYAETHTGNHMAAFIPYASDGFSGDVVCPGEGREYLGVQLLEPLVVGSAYHISAWLKVSPYSIYACNGLGFAFTVDSVFHTGPCPLDVIADVIIDEPIGLEWTHIDTFFIATTEGRYLTIGRFVPDAQMECISLEGSIYNNLNYYFIDDVSVLPLNTGIAHQQIQLTPIINSVQDVLFLASTAPLHGGTLQIYSVSGALVKELTFSTTELVGSFDVRDLPPGGYVARMLGQRTLLFMKE